MGGITNRPLPAGRRSRPNFWDSPAAGVMVVVAASTVVALLAPDGEAVRVSSSSAPCSSGRWSWSALGVPTLVTGTDPTRIPLAALIAPPFGAVATGFLAVARAWSRNR